MHEIIIQNDIALLLRLVLAHLIGDFLLQKGKWIEERNKKKWRAKTLYFHALIIGGLTYLFSGRYSVVWIPVTVMITHLLIDTWKSYKRENIGYFVLDQLAHFIILFIAWSFYIHLKIDIPQTIIQIFSDKQILIVVLSYLFLIWPSAYLIAKITLPWQKEIDTSKGLKDAGKWIGVIERILILTFVLINQFTGIGFLIAAKSILRFGDIKSATNRKEAEYILIGTMVSFIIAILTGLLAVWVINLPQV